MKDLFYFIFCFCKIFHNQLIISYCFTIFHYYFEGGLVRENKLADLSLDLAIRVVKMTDDIKGHYSSKNQLERSATSIGANIREANYAQSKADFISKLHISLKECYETEYWIEVLVGAGVIEEEKSRPIYNLSGTIRRILIASINTAKNK